jgi:hypothetical protein
MSGQELYEFYLVMCKRHGITGYKAKWELLLPQQKQLWIDMTDLLCPELSDEAKEVLNG